MDVPQNPTGRRKNPLIPEPPKQPNKPERRDRPDQPSKSLAEKAIEDVLLHYGDTRGVARRRYREFVEKGIDEDIRPDLQGGGLVRSAGGDKRGLLGRKREERERGDARILGSGDFVIETLKQLDTLLAKKYQAKRSIEELVEIVAGKLGVKFIP